MKKNWIKISLIASAAFGFLILAGNVSAVTDCVTDPVNDPLGLNCVKEGTTALKDTDPRILAAKIINVVLGVLGTIATVLIFYAGFLWMTAAGNDDQIGTAKNILSAAVIGLVIILASFSISSFFVNNLTQVINNTPK